MIILHIYLKNKARTGVFMQTFYRPSYNVRAVIGAGGALEEVNGYYPHGGLLGLPQPAFKRADIFGRATPCLLSVAPMGLNIMIHAYITGVAPAASPPAYYLVPLTGLAAGVSEDSDGMDDTDFPEQR